jgi:hypothetical protein
VHLDIPRRQVRVFHVGGSSDNRTEHLDDSFPGEPTRLLTDILRRVGADGNLDNPGSVSQVDEHNPAEVTAPVHPAPQLHLLPHVLRAQLAAAMGAPGRPSHGVYAPSAAHNVW